jgi:hypothetical protein
VTGKLFVCLLRSRCLICFFCFAGSLQKDLRQCHLTFQCGKALSLETAVELALPVLSASMEG